MGAGPLHHDTRPRTGTSFVFGSLSLGSASSSVSSLGSLTRGGGIGRGVQSPGRYTHVRVCDLPREEFAVGETLFRTADRSTQRGAYVWPATHRTRGRYDSSCGNSGCRGGNSGCRGGDACRSSYVGSGRHSSCWGAGLTAAPSVAASWRRLPRACSGSCYKSFVSRLALPTTHSYAETRVRCLRTDTIGHPAGSGARSGLRKDRTSVSRRNHIKI